MLKYLLVFLLFSSTFGLAQQTTLKKGIVNGEVSIGDSTDVTYSLYLPETFETSKVYPVIFVFDPKGEGTRAAHLFRSGMVQDEFIIASNNQELSDSLEVNIEYGIRFMNNVLRNFPIDSENIYLAGLDKGAAVASGLTFVISNVTGVLAINDIFLNLRLLNKRKEGIILGMVGDASPNYYKMRTGFNQLKKYNRDNLLYVYEDEGGWPRTDYLGSIFNRLFQLNLDNQDRELSQDYINASFEADYSTADALVKRQLPLIADDFLDDLKDKYRRKHDLDSIRDLNRQLRRLRSFKNARRAASQSAEEELFLLEDLDYFLIQDVSMANYENLGYWDDKIQQFEAASQNNGNPQEQKVAKRVLGFIKNSLDDYEQSMASSANVGVDQQIFINVLKTVYNPKDYDAYQRIISIAAKENDINTAYFYLEELLKNGFQDYNRLYNLPYTESLKITPTYNAIIDDYLNKSRDQ